MVIVLVTDWILIIGYDWCKFLSNLTFPEISIKSLVSDCIVNKLMSFELVILLVTCL